MADTDDSNSGDLDSEAREKSADLKATLSKVKEYVVAAQVEGTVELRRAAIVSAAKIACGVMTDLWDNLDELVSNVLDGIGVEDNVEAPVTFGVLISKDTNLTYLTGKDNFRKILRSVTSVAVLQGHLSETELKELVEVTVEQFDELKGQRLSSKDILTQIARVRRVVCRPPFGDEGEEAEEVPPGPDGGSGGGVLEKIKGIGEAVLLIAKVAALFGWVHLAPTEEKVDAPKTPETTELPAFKGLLALLMLCAVANHLLKGQIISSDVAVLTDNLQYIPDPRLMAFTA